MMDDIKYTMAGSKELMRKLGRLDATLRGPIVNQALTAGAQVVKQQAILLLMSGTQTGEWYKRGNVWHHASAPGEPPASDTGHLAGSLSIYSINRETVAVEVGAEYGKFLESEYGTSRMEPRPFMRPAVYNNIPRIEAAINHQLLRGIREAVR